MASPQADNTFPGRGTLATCTHVSVRVERQRNWSLRHAQVTTPELNELPHKIVYSLDGVPGQATPAERLHAGILNLPSKLAEHVCPMLCNIASAGNPYMRGTVLKGSNMQVSGLLCAYSTDTC